MNYEIAIPSYRRHETLAKKTFGLLQRSAMDFDRVTIFVADEEEAKTYEPVAEKFGCKAIAVGVLGIPAQRNFIQNYYPEGTLLLSIDDDIEELNLFINEKLALPIGADLDRFVTQAFEVTLGLGAYIWGIYVVDNPFFMKPTVTQDLKYIMGGFYGMKIRHDPKLEVETGREDAERSILFFIKDGQVVRFNYLAMKTKCFTEPGGMQTWRTKERVRKDVEDLVTKYPLFCEWEQRKKRGYDDVKLVDKRRRKHGRKKATSNAS